MKLSTISLASRRLGLNIDLSDMSAMDNKLASGTVLRGDPLADFDEDAADTLSVFDSTPVPPASCATDIDNLMDFDAFEEPQDKSKKGQTSERLSFSNR